MKKSVALSGVHAGNTAICTVGEKGNDLFYRGYKIEDLTKSCCFEEIYFLLIKGKLPTEEELNNFSDQLVEQRNLPSNLIKTLEQLPKSAHPMNVMQTIVSFMGCIENKFEVVNTTEILENHSKRLLSVLTPALLYWYQFSHNGIRISLKSSEKRISGYFLDLLHQGEFPADWIQTMEASLILYAEHEFNASTFASRVIAGTNSDFFSCIAGAIGALRGSKHGGANEEALKIQEDYPDKNLAKKSIMSKLKRKEIIIGFGHPVYTERDPRNEIIKKFAKALSEGNPNSNLFEVAEVIETTMLREKNIFANLDWYSAVCFSHLNIPVKLFTPIFVIARTAGWSAHIIEQHRENKIIRPSANYVGPQPKEFVSIKERELREPSEYN